jgi:hypothetical protein
MTERETEREIERRMRSGDVLALAKASFWRALAGLCWLPADWLWRLGDRASKRAKRIVDARLQP